MIQGENMNNEIIKTEVAAKYDHTTEMLQEVAERHKDTKVTPENYDEGKAVLKDVKSLETAIESRRVELKAFYLEGGRVVDGRAKELKGIIAPVIDSLKTQIAEIDQKEKDEKQRKERIKVLPARLEQCAALAIEKSESDLLSMSDIEFVQMIGQVQAAKLAEAQRIIDQQNAAILAAENEKNRAAEIESAKAQAAEKARREAEQEARYKVEAAERQAAQAVETAKKEQEEKAKREADEKVAEEKKIKDAGDKAMVQHWASKMLAIPIPELAAGSLYAIVVQDLIKKIEAVKNGA